FRFGAADLPVGGLQGADAGVVGVDQGSDHVDAALGGEPVGRYIADGGDHLVGGRVRVAARQQAAVYDRFGLGRQGVRGERAEAELVNQGVAAAEDRVAVRP